MEYRNHQTVKSRRSSDKHETSSAGHTISLKVSLSPLRFARKLGIGMLNLFYRAWDYVWRYVNRLEKWLLLRLPKPVARFMFRLRPKRRKYPLLARLGWGFMALFVFSTLFIDIVNTFRQVETAYALSPKTQQLLGTSAISYSDRLQFNPQERSYTYNAGYQPGNGVGGQIGGPKFTAQLSQDPAKGISVTDPVTSTSITFKPDFRLQEPQKQGVRMVYPIVGTTAQKVYTLRAASIKEDIVLNHPSKDDQSFSYKLELPAGTEARIEADGGLGIYGVSSELLGNVTTATDADAKLLDAARKNSAKQTLLFQFPAPFIREYGVTKSAAKAWYQLEGSTLTVHASGLLKAQYPLSIDPTIYIESAQKLMRGNNETNIDFDISNELIQKSQTTGARIDSWSSTTNLTSAVWQQGTAVAGGYIYSVGGIGSGTTNTTTYNTAGTSTYTVPAGVTSITVKAWGAGGGGGAGTNGSGTGGSGGGGGYAKAVIAVTPAENLTVEVGTGGSKATANGRAGNGGGYSAVKRSTTFLLEAGGGGGGGGRRGSTGGTVGNGGAGGGSSGVAGSAGVGGGGGGGTASAGGAGGTAGTGGAAGVSGAANAGGNGSSTAACATAATGTGGAGGTGGGGSGGTFTTTCAPGGGGGGGRFGGGGGSSTSTNKRGGSGGGGGSSLVTGSSTVETAGSGTTPGNDADSDRGNLGDGGTGAATSASATAGDNGIILISYTTSGSVTDKVYWAKFNTTTNAIESPNPGAGTCSGWCTNTAYNLPTALKGLSLVSYNGFLYAIGGSNSSNTPQTTVYIAKLGANGEPQLWHPSGGTPVYWYSDTALSNARSYFGMAAYNNRMYILGGLTTSTSILSTNTVQYADIRPDGTFTTWTSTGMQALSSDRYGATAHIYNGVVYIIGGDSTFNGSGTSNAISTVQYAKLNNDGTMNSWQSTNNLVTSGRQTIGGSFSTVSGGYIYVGGGCATVNSSGDCTSVLSDVQLASINADGSLAEWNTIIGLTNDRIGYTFTAWQGGLYRLGGCRAFAGACTDTALDVDYGVINPDGEASTVATSVTNDTGSPAAPCSGSDPYSCSIPTGTVVVGNMLNASIIINGYLYIMGGCTNNSCSTQSTGITYQAVGSDGLLKKPPTCSGYYYHSYCVSSESLPQALGAPGVTVFNNRIYLVGGFTGTTLATTVRYVDVNYDGSLGTWQNADLTTIGAEDVSYTFAYARANPASAGSVPGNLFIFGGCASTTSGPGCGSYTDGVYKCNLNTVGVPSGCTATGQTQIGTPTGAASPGLGAHAGAVYANYIYLMGGLGDGVTDLTQIRYAKFDDSNNVVESDGAGTAAWTVSASQILVGRRRGAGFGYNGYLYVTGGYDGTNALADIEFAKIDVSTGDIGVWEASSVTIDRRWGLTVPVSNSFAYVIGGCTAGAAPSSCTARTSTIQTFQIYNNNSGAPVLYSASANQLTTDRFGASSAIVNGYIYVAGGCTSSADCTTATDSVQYASIDIYGNVGAWTAGGNLPAARAWGQLETVGGTLYFIGGQSSTATDERPEIYYATPVGGAVTWATVSSANDLPDGRTQFSSAVWNNRIFVTGGIAETGGAVSNTVYVSPNLSGGGAISSAWTSTTGFDVARSGHSTVAYANNLYIIGGFTGAQYLNDVQFTQINADGTIDPWTFSTALPTPMRQADAFAANGYIYVTGGRSSDTDCSSKTLVAPISANTTIASGNNPTGVGEWFQTNAKYEGRRYGAATSYYQGKYYIAGGVCDGYPTTSNLLTQNFSTAATSHNVTMPSSVDSGDLLLVLFTNDSTATVTTPSGWTAVTNGSQTGNGQVRGSVFAKSAGGTEDGTNVDFVTSASEEGAAQVYRIKKGEWSGTISEVEAANSGDPAATSSTPNPPNLNPTGWGTENTLWLSYVAGSSYTAVTTFPANHHGGVHNLSNTGTAGASASSTWIESAAANEDPGTYAMSTTSDWVAFTIAIRPKAFSLTDSNSVVQTAVYSQPQVASYSRMIDTDSDVFPTSWLMNGLDNGIGARWQASYSSMHDISSATDTVQGVLQQNPNEDCGTSATMPLMTTWGQATNVGTVTLGNVGAYTAKNSSGGNINCARFYYFSVSIDSSQAFGYPDDVSRGPTLADLSLFYTADPSKRLLHGKTFTGGEQQPLDAPCRRGSSVPGDSNYNCPLP